MRLTDLERLHDRITMERAAQLQAIREHRPYEARRRQQRIDDLLDRYLWVAHDYTPEPV